MNRVQKALARQRERTREALKAIRQDDENTVTLDDVNALMAVLPAIIRVIEVVDALDLTPGGALETARLNLDHQVAHHLDT